MKLFDKVVVNAKDGRFDEYDGMELTVKSFMYFGYVAKCWSDLGESINIPVEYLEEIENECI